MQGAILNGEDLSKIVSTLILIVVAVGASAALWIGANLLFNQVRTSWTRFNALAGYAIGFCCCCYYRETDFSNRTAPVATRSRGSVNCCGHRFSVP